MADLVAGTAVGEGSDTLLGVEGLEGSVFDDTLVGDALSNGLFGGAGNDTISGGDGDDYLMGDFGAFEPAGNDTYDGGLGEDAVSFLFAGAPVSTNLAAGTASGEGGDSITGVEDLIGGPYSDVLTGDTGPNVLLGGLAGADTLSGGDGDDILGGDTCYLFVFLCGGDIENDVLDGGNGTDLASYGLALNPVNANLQTGIAIGDGSDTLRGIESLEGSWEDDTLAGDAFANQLFGLDGDDVLSGLDGDDSLDGGEGTDSLDGGTGTDNCINGESTLNCETSTTGVTTLRVTAFSRGGEQARVLSWLVIEEHVGRGGSI